MADVFGRCHPDVLNYMLKRSFQDILDLTLQGQPPFQREILLRMLAPCSATCPALTCRGFYAMYKYAKARPVTLNHVTVLKSKNRRGQQELTYITLHYLLRDFMGPHWKWDADHGIFRPKDKAGTAMSDDEFQEWLKFNRSRRRERGCGWRGMGGKVVVRNGKIAKISE